MDGRCRMKVSLEFTEDELDTLRAMVYDSRTMHVRDHETACFERCATFCEAIIEDHDRMLAFIEQAQSEAE